MGLSFDSLVFWHWWTLGLVLLILEMMVPTFIFLWMSAAAAVVGGLLFFTPDLSWQVQVSLFSILSVVAILFFRRYIKQHPRKNDQPFLNQRGNSYIGRTFTLTQPIVNGVGEVRVDDSLWRVHGDDLPEGTKIKVVGVSGSSLEIVEATQKP